MTVSSLGRAPGWSYPNMGGAGIGTRAPIAIPVATPKRQSSRFHFRRALKDAKQAFEFQFPFDCCVAAAFPPGAHAHFTSHKRKKARLGCHLFRTGLVTSWRELEANEPLAGDAVASSIGCRKLPPAGSLQSEIGEVSTWPRRVERSFRDTSRGVHVKANGDEDGALNGGTSFLGDFRQNLFENFAARGRRRRIARRICGWERIGAHRCRDWCSSW